MAETADLVVGVAVIALAFKGVVNTANLFDKSSRQGFTRPRIEEIKHRRLGLSAERAPNDSQLPHDPTKVP
jgi:hypothetical protein